MARIDINKHIDADPASVALLLSGPTGRDLWPGETLVLAAPQRSGIGFRIDFSVADGFGRGRILITAAANGPVASDVRFTVSMSDGRMPALRCAAEEFLDALAMAAQARSSAA